MQFDTQITSLVNDAPDVSQLMKKVLYALIPAVLTLLYFYGWGVLINLLLAVSFALILEVVTLKLRGKPVLPFIKDYSAIVTACLFALTLPPLVSWWLILLGLFFAIVIAKHLYGGIGYNPFNPAMIGYAVLIVSFPLQMSQWPAASIISGEWLSLSDSLGIVFGQTEANWDAITRATPLDAVRTGLISGQNYQDIVAGEDFGWLSGRAWQWTSLAYLLGGLYLLKARVISWQIPVSVLLGLATVAGALWLYDGNVFASPVFHLFSGAAMLGAFFIATDPVSASTTPLGQLLYGASIGCLIYVIRTWGAYPDSVAFAVLIMNMAVPMIDYYTQPTVFGESGRAHGKR
ncbi:MAG: electron transport complex subunit RsxD [Proteobacteria bacterium]|nr:MAG: electron transport complex subunit RsxD [Pseudomonadota bacterium]